MGTYYSDKHSIPNVYGGYRAKLVLDGDFNKTDVKITWHIYGQMQYAWGYGLGIKLTGADSGSDTGKTTSGGTSDWKTAASKSGSVTIKRTTSSQSKTFKATAYGVKVGSAPAAGSGSISVSHTVDIAPLEDYTIKYNANGGSGAPSNQTKYYGRTLTLSTKKPTRTGYDFVGWGLSSGDTTKNYDPGDKYTANKSDTLYAIWKKKTYTIKYSANGGTNSGSSSQTKTYGTTLKLLSGSTFKRTGYTLQGWSTSASGGVKYKLSSSYTANASDTLYAVWKAITYTITYKLNGGSSYHSNQTKTYGSSVKLYSDAPKRTNYKFLYWQGSDGKKYNTGNTYSTNANLVLTATWELSVNWMMVGHYDTKTSAYGVSRMNLQIGTTQQKLPDIPNKYGFIGWSKNQEDLQPYNVNQSKFSKTVTVPAGNVPEQQRYVYGVYRDISPSAVRILQTDVIRVDSTKMFDDFYNAIDNGETFESITGDTTTLFGYCELTESARNISTIQITVNTSGVTTAATARVGTRLFFKLVKSNGNFLSSTEYNITINLTDLKGKPITARTTIKKIASIFDIAKNDSTYTLPTDAPKRSETYQSYETTYYPIYLGPRVTLYGTTVDVYSNIGYTAHGDGGVNVSLVRMNELNETVIGGAENSGAHCTRSHTIITAPSNKNIYLGTSGNHVSNIIGYGNTTINGNLSVNGTATITGTLNAKSNIYIGGHTGYVGQIYTNNSTTSYSTTADTWRHITACSTPTMYAGTYIITSMVRIEGTTAGEVYGLAIGYTQNNTNYYYTYSRTSHKSYGGNMQFTTQYIASISSSMTCHPTVYGGDTKATIKNKMIRAVQIK